jgi:hypothetical protein
LESAAERYEGMLGSSPQEAWIHVVLGQTYAAQSSPESALLEYQAAINFLPNLPMAHQRLAQIYADGQNANQAIEHYQIFLVLELYGEDSDEAREELERMSGYAITAPPPGAQVTGTVSITGTAELPDFLFYKLEYGVGTDPVEWVTIEDAVTAPMKDGLLGRWHTAGMPAGDYVLRLVVVDETYNYPPAYRVPVFIPEAEY